ncbi:MAG: alanine--tRNA ligase [Bacteroidetes bacterium]|nr:alanine--tRNA ligase [Bacteroidota bacterium]
MRKSSEIRQAFLDFFASKGHAIVPSAPIVVKNDPTLLFTNAGMNQFKDYFLGNQVPSHTRIADTQKCLRVSGKHNDLEEVGVDTYHHTMFEMLGNWSFGDYFKGEAIEWSWELLTKVYGIDPAKLYVTVFEGDASENLPPSSEALLHWKKWVAEDKIIYGNKKDNFWEMGDTGPCGPCSEIHVDMRSEEEIAKIPGRDLVNKDHPQVIEIWNNVFIQYNRKKDGSLEALPNKHVDTGMGFERLVRVIQNKKSNYDTDVFTGTIEAVEKITHKTYDYSDTKEAVAFRVIADHIRAIAFTIADGQLPANTGAGYVIRRILRRAVRYYYSYLDYKHPLLHQLMPNLAKQFENVFPELTGQLDFVTKVVKEEEEGFLRTLEKGLKRMDDIIASHPKQAAIEGKLVFELFDTFGFPVDLTRLIASENELQVDEAGFEKEMLQQKNRSRAATAIDTGDWVQINPDIETKFIGYTATTTNATVVKYRKVKAKGKEAYQWVLSETPFYAESGGQVGDTGSFQFEDGSSIEVTDTKKENNLFIHFTDNLPSNISNRVKANVNIASRKATTLHHSATHLLHAALRNILGKHVAQKGSLVNTEQLRFDFSHFAKMTAEEISQVETMVNAKIKENIPVVIKEMNKEEAIGLGAMALFGEKYGDKVRVVIMDPAYSIELCGGTHVGHTGEIEHFILKAEASVAAGVRRIEAVVGNAAQLYLTQMNEKLHKQIIQLTEACATLAEQLSISFQAPQWNESSSVDVLNDTIVSLQASQKELSKKLESREALLVNELTSQYASQFETINGIAFLGKEIQLSSADNLKKLAVALGLTQNNHCIILTAKIESKAAVVLSISESLSTAMPATQIIKDKIAPLIKGGGGGQKTLASAGGQDATQLDKVIEVVKGLL